MRFEFKTIYYPTGSVTITSGEFDSEVDFFRHLNYWNKQAKGMYLYTADYLFPVGCAALDIDNMTLVYPGTRNPHRVYEEAGWWTPLSSITVDNISVDEFYEHIIYFKQGLSTELEPDHYRSIFKKLCVTYTTINTDDPDLASATERFAEVTAEYKSLMTSKEYDT